MNEETLRSALPRAYYRLGRAFGWTPREVEGLTMAEVALYLEYLDREK